MKLTSVLFVALCCFVAVQAICPHNCHDQGTCNHDVCECYDGWTGDDCSIETIPLTSGVPRDDSMSTFTWKYYYIQVPSDMNGLRITVHQTNTFGDVDVFVQRGSLPSHSSNIANDTSTSFNIELDIVPSPPGTYYIGTYAYFHVEYTIQVDMLNACTVDCGEHGFCAHNMCQCNENYVGDQCEIFDMAIDNIAIVEDTIEDYEFHYFHTDVAANSVFNLVVGQDDTPDADVDVYLRRGAYPTIFEFDSANATTESITTISMNSPDAGTWYIGIYGFHGCSYTLNLEVSSRTTCRSECSQHGSCSGSHCNCNHGFNGDYCETMNDKLAIGESQNGYVEAGAWNYYHFQETTANNVDIHIHQADDAMDCDLYVASERTPSTYDFDYADVSFDADYDIVVVNPSTTTWQIGVYGWTNCNYEITMSIPTQCPCVPGHGTCAPGSALCMCNIGYTGPMCERETDHIENGEVYDDFVSANEWKYYSITTNSSAMLISMKEHETEGVLWLFASLSGFPTLDASDGSDKNTNTDFHEVHFVYPEMALRTYFIGVYGSPFELGQEVPFSITAWSPPL